MRGVRWRTAGRCPLYRESAPQLLYIALVFLAWPFVVPTAAEQPLSFARPPQFFGCHGFGFGGMDGGMAKSPTDVELEHRAPASRASCQIAYIFQIAELGAADLPIRCSDSFTSLAYIKRQIQEVSLREWQQIWTTTAKGHG